MQKDKLTPRLAAVLVWFWLTLILASQYLALLFPSQQDHAGQSQPQTQAETQEVAAVEGPSPDDRIADYTLWLTIFTAVLGVGTLALWWETRRAGNLARAEFIASHRPSVIVRAIRSPEQRDYYAKALAGDTEQPMQWLFIALANVGESDATIVEFTCDYRVIFKDEANSIEPIPLGTATVNPGTPIIIKVGEQKLFEVTSATIKSGTGYIGTKVVSGRVQYADLNGVVRSTGFGRTEHLNGFAASENPEEEYTD